MRVWYVVRLPGPFAVSTSHRVHLTSGFTALVVGVLRLFWWATVASVLLVCYAVRFLAREVSQANRQRREGTSTRG